MKSFSTDYEEGAADLKKMAYEIILDKMKEKIAAGVWKPGERLPTLQQLAEEFSLSLTSVREGLRILESKRLISIEHGRGMFVSNDPFLLQDAGSKVREMENISLLHLLEARMVLEPEMAALCAERASASQVKQIRGLAELMEKEMKKGSDFFATDLSFHEMIAEGADNPIMSQMLSAVSDLLAVSRRQTDRLPHMKTKASNYHLLIAIAIEERQPEQARLLMQAHLKDMATAVRKVMGRSGSDK